MLKKEPVNPVRVAQPTMLKRRLANPLQSKENQVFALQINPIGTLKDWPVCSALLVKL